MIAFNALGVRFTLPLLTLLYPLLARQLGMSGRMGSLFLALAVHELAHVLAALSLGVRIREIRLTPFGGSARMENPYGVAARRIIPVALAGPAANLLLAVIFSALAHWRWISPGSCNAHVQYNLVLCLFNLLPALPLDGGRILYALTHRCLGESAALALGLWLGGVLAAALMLFALLGGFKTGRWNLSFVLAAIFILASRRDERAALSKSRAQRLCRLQAQEGILPVRIYQCSAETPVRDALNRLRPRENSWFAVYRNEGYQLITGERILSHLIQNDAADACLGDLAVPCPGGKSAAN